MEDYLSSNFHLMAHVLDEVAVQTEPVTDQAVQTRFPRLREAARWSAAIGTELRALTEGRSLTLIRKQTALEA